MKRVLRNIGLIWMFSLVLCGCSSGEDVSIKDSQLVESETESTEFTSEKEDTQETQASNDTQSMYFAEEVSVNIYERTEENIEVVIEYPYFDEENSKINSIIEEFIVEAYEKDVSPIIEYLEENQKLTLEIDYEVVNYDDNFISVVFDGYGFVSGSAHGFFVGYALTVDLNDECVVSWNDCFDNSAQILEIVYNGNYDVTYGGLMTFSGEEIYEVFENRLQKSDDVTTFFFIQDGKPCFIIGDLGYVYGGYSIVQLEISN